LAPSHVGLGGNEMADKLAKKGTTLHSKETSLQADTLKKHLNCNIAMKYNKKQTSWLQQKWRNIHKIWAEYKGKPMKEVVANFDSRQDMTA